jgi:hypothetical protein
MWGVIPEYSATKGLKDQLWSSTFVSMFIGLLLFFTFGFIPLGNCYLTFLTTFSLSSVIFCVVGSTVIFGKGHEMVQTSSTILFLGLSVWPTVLVAHEYGQSTAHSREVKTTYALRQSLKILVFGSIG